MVNAIIDNHGRPITYVRLAVTDRCNLRCFYCMPAEGIKYLPRKELLTYEEMERLLRVLATMGITKVRITGGEPFVRKDLISFLKRVTEIPGIKQVHITTNGVLTTQHVPELKKIGISSVNLSLDTMDKARFAEMTRRDEYDKVMECFHALVDHGIRTKINAVIMEGKNTQDIIPLAELAKDYPVDVRFIEEMPFNGSGANYPKLGWNHKRIYEELEQHYPNILPFFEMPGSTVSSYQIRGYKGKLGIIAAFTRTFCRTCNRIRMTAQGTLKTCLYDDGVMDIRKIMRNGASDEELAKAFQSAIGTRAKDGFEAEKNRKHKNPVSESMSTIGG